MLMKHFFTMMAAVAALFFVACGGGSSTPSDAVIKVYDQLAKGNYRATCIISEHCWDNMKEFDWRKFLNDNGKTIYPGEPINAERLASMIEHMSGCETRATVVGYTQRGALPTAKDSAFAFEAGHLAVRLLHDGVSNQVIGTRLGRVFHMGIQEALKEERHFRHDLYKLVNDIRE